MAAPIVGAVFGMPASAWTLRDNKLPIFTSVRDFRTALKRKKG